MVKKPWLFTLIFVLLLAVASLAVASCNIVATPNTTTPSPQVKCNGRQANANGNGSPTTTNSCSRRLLVFSKTGGFRHASIKDGKIALQKLATEHNFVVDFTEDSSVFTDANLVHYNAVVFLMTTGKILDDNQKVAFERYIRAGGGYVGVHSASDTEYTWSWYGGLVGAYFDRIHGHSKIVQATIHVTDRTHPSTMMLPAVWIRTDEWYNFASNPRGRVHELMTIDERTYKGGTMGADHPIAWYHEYDGGRAWYTAMGHTSESYYEPLFLAHLWGGIIYATGGKQGMIAAPQAKRERDIVLQITHGSSIAPGFVALAQTASFFLYALIGGGVADRVDKRSFLLVTQSLSMLLASIFGILTITGVDGRSAGILFWHSFEL